MRSAFVVNFLAASRDLNFKWYATWNVFLGPAAATFTTISSVVDSGVVIVRIAWNATNALDELA